MASIQDGDLISVCEVILQLMLFYWTVFDTIGILFKTEDTFMKKCCKCKEEKSEIEFHKDRTTKDGLEYKCKKCKSEQRKESRKKNPEHYREACRRSALKNYETIRASQKKHRTENREKINNRRREARIPRREEINKREKERRERDPNHLLKMRILNKRNREKNKEKLKPMRDAHKLVMYAIRLGVIIKKYTCEMCSSNVKIEGHHDDYTKPLEVRWLCKSCHNRLHLDFRYQEKQKI